jgi:cathepsin L
VHENGIISAEDYSYEAKNNSCRRNGKTKTDVKLYDFIFSHYADHEFTKAALADYGPLALSIRVNFEFMFYSEGIFTFNDCVNRGVKETNHHLLLVGYGHDDEKNLDYWIVKNSWGKSWGENGYARILISKKYRRCGFPITYTFPILTLPENKTD